MSAEASRSEVEALRQRLSEYEKAFAATAPRLAAFKQLEDLARLQRSTPEAIAVKAALDVLREEKEETQTRLTKLRTERDSLLAEVSLVLIQKKTHDEQGGALRAEVESLSSIRDDLRSERDQLKAERDDLAVEREALSQTQGSVEYQREELQAEESELQGRRDELRLLGKDLEESLILVHSELGSLMEAKQSLQTEIEGLSNELDHRRAEIELEPAKKPCPPDTSDTAVASDDTAVAREDDPNFGFDDKDADTEDAFGRFFDADIDHDKSRDWILK